MPDLSLVAKIIELYPDLVALLGHPEIGPILIEAVTSDQGLSQAALNSKIRQTHWYQTTPASAREAMMQRTNDPATFYQQHRGKYNDLLDWATQLGVWMPGEEANLLGEWMLNEGRDINDSEVQYHLRRWLMEHPDRAMMGGAVQAATRQAEAIARQHWFTAPDQAGLQQWGIDLALGIKDEAQIDQELATKAAILHPHLKDRITAGETMADIVNPFREIVARELELGDIDQVDMNSAQWQWLTGVPDPQAGETRMPTMQEVQTAARRDPRWWKTSGGRQAESGLARTLLQAFGKVA